MTTPPMLGGMSAVLSPLTAVDGDNIAIYDWPHAVGGTRAVVLLVHGLGEHMGRYNHLAHWFNVRGFAVRGYDQVGHGESDGRRGGLPSPDRLLEDLADVYDNTRLQYSLRRRPMPPVLLLGHSMGGLVAADFVNQQIRPVDGLVLSSPALDAGLTDMQKRMLGMLHLVAPGLRIANGINTSAISRDQRVVAAYKGDRRVHNRIGIALAKFIADAGPDVLSCAPQWTVPTLLLYAGQDQLVKPEGSRAFAAAAPAEVVTARCFEHHYHEVFNDSENEVVLEELKTWLDARF